ncbi:MAG: hypothetical protein ABMA14_20240 [Hyphomonadaceae bacterium]
MTFSLAWFAAQGIAREDFLEHAGFDDTGEVDEYFEEEHSVGELPGGWVIIVTSDVGLLAPAKLAQWSVGGRLVAAVVHEGSMNSLATEWVNGKQIWSLAHDGSEGGESLEVEGELPDVFEELKQEADAAQAESEKEGGGVDFVFDIPLDVAAEITGFRHDEMGFDDDIPPFTALERIHIAE